MQTGARAAGTITALFAHNARSTLPQIKKRRGTVVRSPRWNRQCLCNDGRPALHKQEIGKS